MEPWLAQSFPTVLSSLRRTVKQYVASTDCPLQNTKQALWFWHCLEIEFCSSLLNGVHLYVTMKHYTRSFVLLIPKASVVSVLFTLFFTMPQEQSGEGKVTGEAQTAEGAEQPAWWCDRCVCDWEGGGGGCHILLQPPHLSSTAGLCNGGGHGVTICQEVCIDSRGLCSSHYQCLDIPLLIIIQVYSKPGGA